jgi:hemolysin activation/secretion protein
MATKAEEKRPARPEEEEEEEESDYESDYGDAEDAQAVQQQQQQQLLRRQQQQQQQQQQQVAPPKEEKKGHSGAPSVRLDLNIELEVTLKARIHGDLTLALLYVFYCSPPPWLTVF